MQARQSPEANELNDRIGVLIAQHHAIGAEIVACLAELHELDGWQGEGYRSLAHWLSIRGSYTMTEAKQYEMVATRLETMQPIVADAAVGKHSVGVMAMAARIATPETIDTIMQILRDATPSQAARVFAKYRDCKGENGGCEPEPEVDYWKKHWRDDLGRERWNLALDGPTSALLEQAWEAARAAGERGVDPLDLEQRRRLNANEIASRLAQTMVDAANGAGMTTGGGERYCVQISTDLATLARLLGYAFDPLTPVGLGSHAFIPATRKRLTDAELSAILCDSTLQLLVHHDGIPLWLGQEVRTATRHQRRALMFRAGVKGCEFPGCTQTRFVDAHHVRWVSSCGPTDIDNLVLLCGYHHRQIHDKTCAITSADGQRFTFWRGERCLGTTVRGDSTGGRPPDAATLPVVDGVPAPPPWMGPRTPTSTGGGERLSDFGLSVYLERLLAA